MSQQGVALLITEPPQFTGFEVVGGTWQEKDSLKDQATLNRKEETFNVTFWDPGVDAQCDLVALGANSTRIAKGQTLTESGGLARVWVVMDVDYKGFGSKALVQSVKLMFRAAMQP